MDLEHSFGPIYARGILRQGRTAFAVLGVNQQETQSSIDAALTFTGARDFAKAADIHSAISHDAAGRSGVINMQGRKRNAPKERSRA